MSSVAVSVGPIDCCQWCLVRKTLIMNTVLWIVTLRRWVIGFGRFEGI
jgi:hypothetical protein